MIFNSIDFAIFLPIVFFLYWFVTNKSLRIQNGLLLLSSYFFYACWDWRFLFLLMFSTLLDYYTALKMSAAQTQDNKKFWFWLSVIVNLGFLGVFKYYNFFADNFATALAQLGLQVNPWTIKVILPVGISFYTFHGLSYVIDIYRDKIKAERYFVDYAVFVSFFPLLVAGPIERATHLLPQVKQKRVFDYALAVDGLRQILWGLFKKIVIADNCAEYANLIFNNSAEYSGSTLILGVLFFTFQIYADFSGYSDIAIGTGKLFGFKLLQNFAFPYFSRDFAEAWRRWHISLTTWFRDYLFMPLMRAGKINAWTKVRNILILFATIGFWHGAKWTFIVWGILHAIYFIPTVFRKDKKKNSGVVAQGKVFPSVKETLQMARTFSLVVFSMIFFRAESIHHALSYISGILSPTVFSVPHFVGMKGALRTLAVLVLFLVVEWRGREGKYALDSLIVNWKRPFRYGLYYTIIILIFLYGGKDQEFIYFQF